jgi:hypothetical protein
MEPARRFVFYKVVGGWFFFAAFCAGFEHAVIVALLEFADIV